MNASLLLFLVHAGNGVPPEGVLDDAVANGDRTGDSPPRVMAVPASQAMSIPAHDDVAVVVEPASDSSAYADDAAVVVAPASSGMASMAQEPNATERVAKTHESFSIGMTVQRLHDDFGLGGTLSSPSFAAHSLRFTANGGVAWFPHARTSSGNETWEPYGHVRVAFEAGHRIADTPLRLYGFGGTMLMFVPESISSDATRFGGFGGFGFEFFMPRHKQDGPVSYTIELGGFGTSGVPDGAVADNVPGDLVFGSGFLISAGMRFYPLPPRAYTR